jgi:hypothetical protein
VRTKLRRSQQYARSSCGASPHSRQRQEGRRRQVACRCGMGEAAYVAAYAQRMLQGSVARGEAMAVRNRPIRPRYTRTFREIEEREVDMRESRDTNPSVREKREESCLSGKTLCRRDGRQVYAKCPPRPEHHGYENGDYRAMPPPPQPPLLPRLNSTLVQVCGCKAGS